MAKVNVWEVLGPKYKGMVIDVKGRYCSCMEGYATGKSKGYHPDCEKKFFIAMIPHGLKESVMGPVIGLVVREPRKAPRRSIKRNR